jgi:hypothetical protein
MTVFIYAGLDAGGRYDAGPEDCDLRMERPGAVGIRRQTPARMPFETRRGHALRSTSVRSRVGRTVQVCVRAAVRSNQARVGESGNSWGHAADRQSPSACGTQGVVLLSWPGCLRNSEKGGSPPPLLLQRQARAPCTGRQVCRSRGRQTWRRGRGETPMRSARPFRGVEESERRPVALSRS